MDKYGLGSEKISVAIIAYKYCPVKFCLCVAFYGAMLLLNLISSWYVKQNIPYLYRNCNGWSH